MKSVKKIVYETNQKDTDIKVNVSKTVFNQMERVKHLAGKQTVLENNLKSVESDAMKYKEEISVLKRTLNEASDEIKQKKLEYNTLAEK